MRFSGIGADRMLTSKAHPHKAGGGMATGAIDESGLAADKDQSEIRASGHASPTNRENE